MISRELEKSLNAAVREARNRRHEYFCVEHLLYALLDDPYGAEIIQQCGGNLPRLRNQIERFFEDEIGSVEDNREVTLRQTPAFDRILQRAFRHVQSCGKDEVDAGDVLVAIFSETDSHAAFYLTQQGISRMDVVEYIAHRDFERTYGFGDDEDPMLPEWMEGEDTDSCDVGQKRKDAQQRPALEVYAVNLNERAAQGKLDPLVGRIPELRRAMRVLARRRKNNPIFVGEAGVGKTALAEGLALRIHEGNVPDMLKAAVIYALDLPGMLAGTKYRGDFEQRIKAVLQEVKERPEIILYIDEIHTIVGAGATSESSIDASSIIKPMLASGELRCIGSTTYEEYKNRFEKDRGLSRRFQKIDIGEPSHEETVRILHGLKPHYERHHGIQFTPAAIRAAVELSTKHLMDRFHPDKAIDVLDEAAAAVRLEGVSGRKTVRPADIETVVAEMANVPVKTVSSSDREKLADLEPALKRGVFGQDEAIVQIARAIKRARAGLGRQNAPIGSYLFTGPTGVGKTEVARQLAGILGNHFARYDMSEYMEKHAVSRLIGAPPGYVGFDQGGLLVDEIRRHPYTVLLLDEIEKAHPDLFSILLQVMDNATLTDNMGRRADFRNVVLIMTSNAGAREMATQSIGFRSANDDPGSKGLKALEKALTPEFRNRLDAIVTFNQLPVEIIERIVEKFMDEIRVQLMGRKVKLELTPEARTWLAQNGFDPKFGARPLRRLIQHEIETPLSDEILFGHLENGGEVTVDIHDSKIVFK